MREQHYPSGARHMPLENDFTRVFNAIKELEARVERIELLLPPSPTCAPLHSIYATESVTPKQVDTITVEDDDGDWQPQEPDYKALFESEQRERRIDAERRLLTLKSLEQTSSENNQLRFILSILAAVKDGGWIEWNGGECPVGEGVKVEARFRDGDMWSPAPAREFDWIHCDNPLDIIAYRIAR